ncbi:unnamed protein product [Phyllotreta striolata]|uniref:Uncharacterized protein n=1 Tax=Phyllotreta striolata TaxID=444603 RepID=A0A9N9XL88_PHYSR|nr:unnamed protein product [Phyllotreta striolata]
MIVLPAPPPKDYRLEEINKRLLSSHLFTPNGELRITQPTIGKHCVPIHYRDDEARDLSRVSRRKPHPKILEKFMFNEKYSWVTAQGKDDFLIHDMYKKYTVKSPSYDPRFMHKEKIFNRSCQYEMSCSNALRHEKFEKKVKKDDLEFEYYYGKLAEIERAKKPPDIQIRPCIERAPYWWLEKPDETIEKKKFPMESLAVEPPRFFDIPNFTAFVKDDPCRRKKDMLLVGRKFKHDACLWYYETYPPPNIKFLPKKLE